MTQDLSTVSLTCFSDILCIWSYVSEVRLEEVKAQFGDQVEISHRFCSVFGDTQHKIGDGWADRGGFAAFAAHTQEVVERFEHLAVHSDIWVKTCPASSTPAHLMLKAVQRVQPSQLDPVLKRIRRAFFVDCEDIGRWSVLESIVEGQGIEMDRLRGAIESGVAYADLEADQRGRTTLMVPGSPTYILNNGRQRLFGNVGYRVIEANIKELLHSPAAGFASWC